MLIWVLVILEQQKHDSNNLSYLHFGPIFLKKMTKRTNDQKDKWPKGQMSKERCPTFCYVCVTEIGPKLSLERFVRLLCWSKMSPILHKSKLCLWFVSSRLVQNKVRRGLCHVFVVLKWPEPKLTYKHRCVRFVSKK